MKNDLTQEQLNQPITVTLPLSAVLRIGAPLPAGGEEALAFGSAALRTGIFPVIGSKVGDDVYAGMTLDGETPVPLFLLPGEFSGTWEDAKKWAAAQGGELPSRIDQLVLFKNLKKEFKSEWYWSGEQHATHSGYAWMQYFDDGSQNYFHQVIIFRARAVRRKAI
jgi:hypothetical protein